MSESNYKPSPESKIPIFYRFYKLEKSEHVKIYNSSQTQFQDKVR